MIHKLWNITNASTIIWEIKGTYIQQHCLKESRYCKNLRTCHLHIKFEEKVLLENHIETDAKSHNLNRRGGKNISATEEHHWSLQLRAQTSGVGMEIEIPILLFFIERFEGQKSTLWKAKAISQSVHRTVCTLSWIAQYTLNTRRPHCSHDLLLSHASEETSLLTSSVTKGMTQNSLDLIIITH